MGVVEGFTPMETIELEFSEAVKLAAIQNYEYDMWNDPEDMDSWEKMKERYIEEAKFLFNYSGENYLPDEGYNKSHPGKEHAYIVVKR